MIEINLKLITLLTILNLMCLKSLIIHIKLKFKLSKKTHLLFCHKIRLFFLLRKLLLT